VQHSTDPAPVNRISTSPAHAAWAFGFDVRERQLYPLRAFVCFGAHMRSRISVTVLLCAATLVAGCRSGSAAPTESGVASPALPESSTVAAESFAVERVQAQQLALESAQVATWVSQAYATGCTDAFRAASGVTVSLDACEQPPRYRRPAQRVLLIGSSTMGGAIGVPLSRLLEASGVRVRNRGEASTGLARADHVDWKERVVEEIQDFEPDLVIAQIGGNDCQPIIAPDRDVRARRSDLARWHRVYAEVLTELVQAIRGEQVEVMLVDLQPARRPEYSDCVRGINAVTRQVAAAFQLPFFSVWEVTDGADGEYVEHLMVDGEERNIRASDGYHLSTHGGRLSSRAMYEAMVQQRLVAPWSEPLFLQGAR
jgi:hypothetical protein